MTNKKMILSAFLALATFTACGDQTDNNLTTPGSGQQQPGNTEEDKSDENGASKTVWMLTTTATKSSDLKESELTAKTGESKDTKTLTILPGDIYQEIDGFGSAITGAAAENLLKMKQADRTSFLEKTFSPSKGYGFSYIRVPIGCSDFSRTEYTLCDTEGIDNFALTKEETDLLIPVIKEILAINPEVKVLGSPWTAPRWMKVNNLKDLLPYSSWTSGQLNPKYYEDYGTYFVKWIQALKDNGIDVYAVTPQNEPLNRGNSASMYMGWEEERDFIKQGLGPKLREAGLNTKIYAFDHNYNYDGIADQQSYPLKIYEDSEAAQYIAGAAYHNYGGTRAELINVHKAAPDKELVFTESTDGEWNDGGEDKADENVERRLLSTMEDLALGTVNNWCKGVILWNLMLDQKHGPFSPADGSCKTGYGTVDLLFDGSVRKNAYYYILAHMSSVAQPGAVRIATTGNQPNVISSAFRNPDGTYGLVLLNKKPEGVDITVADGEWYFPVSIPGNSVVSLKW